MRDAVIVDGVRTPIGNPGGSLSGFRAEELAALAIKELVARVDIEPEKIDDVYVACAICHRHAASWGRWAALKAGLPYSVPGMGIERQCSGSLQAISLAAQAIMSDHADVIVAGGMESWSTLPFLLERYSQPKPFGMQPPSILPLTPEVAPADMDLHFPMGITAENLAEAYSISREEQDEYGLRSQERALKAIADGKFKDEIVPVEVPQRKGDPIVFDTDERPRVTSMEKLAALRPALKKDGTVTAGNSSGLNDGAVANLVMGKDTARDLGLKPIGRYVTTAVVGVDPSIMGIGAAEAIKKVMKRSGLDWNDIDLVECNEAFAAQTLAVVKELGNSGLEVDIEKLNVNGGAIALGHPNGMSGGRLALTLLRELRRRKQRYGIAALCVGGGQGVATILEAVY